MGKRKTVCRFWGKFILGSSRKGEKRGRKNLELKRSSYGEGGRGVD